MIITRLELRNFRSYPSLSLDFSEKDNVLIGKTAREKRILLKESIFSLCVKAGEVTISEHLFVKERKPLSYARMCVRVRCHERLKSLLPRKGKDFLE